MRFKYTYFKYDFSFYILNYKTTMNFIYPMYTTLKAHRAIIGKLEYLHHVNHKTSSKLYNQYLGHGKVNDMIVYATAYETNQWYKNQLKSILKTVPINVDDNVDFDIYTIHSMYLESRLQGINSVINFCLEVEKQGPIDISIYAQGLLNRYCIYSTYQGIEPFQRSITKKVYYR